ncbi:hypothetical protein E2542_SST04735 [Spatholobus suberectus]|nr:hypothetical protein E2542_SST04735 [Spatholobus suberectus]
MSNLKDTSSDVCVSIRVFHSATLTARARAPIEANQARAQSQSLLVEDDPFSGRWSFKTLAVEYSAFCLATTKNPCVRHQGHSQPSLQPPSTVAVCRNPHVFFSLALRSRNPCVPQS